MAGGTWERCVREVTLAADPETVGSVGVGWSNLSAGLGHLRDALVGRSFVGPIASGQERPHSGGLPGLLAGWTGSGGDAYREHLGGIGKDIEELITHASDVSGALSRIEGDIRKAVASIPIPLMDDFGWNEWSLPGGTELDDARDGESQSGFLASLRSDYQQNQSLYADGAFRDKADDLEATMRVDGNADDQKRGGWWDTKSHLDNWYRDNQEAANRAMSPLPAAVETERPKLVVPQPSANDARDGYTPDNRVPPSGVPDAGLPGGGGGGGGKVPSLGSAGIGGGGGGSYGGGSFSPPPTTGGVDLGGGQTGGGSYVPPVTGGGYPGSGDHDYGTGLAGAGGPGTITTGGPGSAFGGGGLGTVGGGGGFGGGGAGLGAGGGPGGGGLGAAGGPGVGALPGLVGGGNGKVPPLTSAASALRNATGAGAGGGMMGGGMMGGHGGAGHGGGGAEHSSWLTEDDDPWGAGDSASPGILR